MSQAEGVGGKAGNEGAEDEVVIVILRSQKIEMLDKMKITAGESFFSRNCHALISDEIFAVHG